MVAGAIGDVATQAGIMHRVAAAADGAGSNVTELGSPDAVAAGGSAPKTTEHRGLVILSFDDGPADDTGNPNNPALHQILAVLGEDGIVAEFYLRGGEAKGHPNDSLAIADAGHVIQNHGWEHPLSGIDDWPYEDVERDIRSAQEMILARTGKAPTRFRPPTGAGGYRNNPDPEIYSVAESLGLTVTNWDIDSKDSAYLGGQSIIRIDHVTRELNRMKGRQNIIILLHVKKNTARDLPMLINAIRESGFGFADPSKEYEWP